MLFLVVNDNRYKSYNFLSIFSQVFIPLTGALITCAILTNHIQIGVSMENKLKTKPLTRCVMTIAEVGCYFWQLGRCKLWRQISDFDYYVFDLRSQYPNQLVYKYEVADLPFFSRSIDNDDKYERTSSIKIGDCCIQYTFNKIRRLGLVETTEVLPLFEHIDPYKNQLENIIAQTKISHNEPKKLKVLKLNRKEKNVVQLHSK